MFTTFTTPSYSLIVGDRVYRCSMGRTGIKSAVDKKEGDGATPAGDYHFRQLYYRSDRIQKSQLHTDLTTISLTKLDGWCDEVDSEFYNCHVKLPFLPSHEELWRDDQVYDIIVVIGYNDQPVVKGKGSAIFMHIAHEGYLPTAGCIALQKEDLLQILPYLGPEAKISIDLSGKARILPAPMLQAQQSPFPGL